MYFVPFLKPLVLFIKLLLARTKVKVLKFHLLLLKLVRFKIMAKTGKVLQASSIVLVKLDHLHQLTTTLTFQLRSDLSKCFS